ncbi:hypothetical protein ISCGN_005482 [Ixodes scapularis]
MAKLSGYRAYGKDAKEKTRVTTLVRRNLPVIEHDTGISTVEHVLIEVISNTKKDGRSVFVLNVYSSPAKRHRFAALFWATLEIAKQQALVVVGDFNAPHPDCGYLTETVKGRNLCHVAHDEGLTLITDPDQPTRRGDARHRDTTPDLAFLRNMLRNLGDGAVTGITRYMNACWERGSTPQQWKTTKVVMIPKPGKRPQLDSLRPISLTSCAGKLMEHVVLGRLNRYIEERDLFPHTMVGFWPHLSTQDVMLRLKHQIVDSTGSSPLDTKAIPGLDLTKAFDNIIHDAVLDNLRALAVGKRTYEYIQNFLSERKARLAVGGVESEDICLGGKGMPQGSVLSPYLFNVAMICLPVKVEKTAGLQHSIYADDITLWVTGGSDGYIEEVLQEAIQVVEDSLVRDGHPRFLDLLHPG